MEQASKTEKRIVLVGGTGFLGRHITEKLVRDGYKNIILVSRGGTTGTLPSAVSSAQANFGNTEEMNRILHADDVVVHLGCTTIPWTSELDRAGDIADNVIGTVNLLESCVSRGIRKFVYVSSGGTVYGNHGAVAVLEEVLCAPIGAHGAMKLSTEQHVKLYKQQFGLETVIVRPSNVYGRTFESGREQGAVEIFLARALNDKPISIWGDGTVTRDYVYIDDFFSRILRDDVTGGVYNVGSGTGASLRELLDLIGHVTQKNIMVNYLEPRTFDVPYVVLDVSKAKSELGWSPKYSLADGFADYYRRLNLPS
ncbi:MAG: NAD-dependent epimerase/dehydratase family protein [Candidatus Nitrotoga sp.]